MKQQAIQYLGLDVHRLAVQGCTRQPTRRCDFGTRVMAAQMSDRSVRRTKATFQKNTKRIALSCHYLKGSDGIAPIWCDFNRDFREGSKTYRFPSVRKAIMRHAVNRSNSFTPHVQPAGWFARTGETAYANNRAMFAIQLDH